MNNLSLHAGSIYTQNGNLGTNVAGFGFTVKEGTDGRMGVATLSGGSVVVSNTTVTANTRIFVVSQSGTTNAGFLSVSTRTAGTSFTIVSSNASDARQVAYMMFEPTA